MGWVGMGWATHFMSSIKNWESKAVIFDNSRLYAMHIGNVIIIGWELGLFAKKEIKKIANFCYIYTHLLDL